MKLNDDELKLVAIFSGSTNPRSIEDIAEAFYMNGKGTIDRPKTWRQSLMSRMRILSFKTYGQSFQIDRVSGRGRGKIALYAPVAKFKRSDIKRTF